MGAIVAYDQRVVVANSFPGRRREYTDGWSEAAVRALLDPSGRAQGVDLVEFLGSQAAVEGERRRWEAEIAFHLASPMPMADTPVVDLFSGCGGLSLGFEIAGFKVLAGIDNWEAAIETYGANLDHDALVSDLEDVDATLKILERYRDLNGRTPGIIGGPPCQDFSLAGKRIGEKRAALTEKFAETVIEAEAPFFVMENVPNALKFAVYQNALAQLRRAGFKIRVITLNAVEWGVPQRRRRLFAFGTRSERVSDWIFEDLSRDPDGRILTVREWFGESAVPDFYYRHPRSYQRRGIFSVDEPSPTIRGVNRPIPPEYQDHPGNPVRPDFPSLRALTAGERAQIQSFPEGFTLIGPRSTIEQMVGNAVPVRLATEVARSVARGLKSW